MKPKYKTGIGNVAFSAFPSQRERFIVECFSILYSVFCIAVYAFTRNNDDFKANQRKSRLRESVSRWSRSGMKREQASFLLIAIVSREKRTGRIASK